jgi:hypothetical protein
MDIADRHFLGFRKRQKFFDGAEKSGYLPVMVLDLAGDVFVSGKDFAQPDEGAHDGHVYVSGPVAAEHTGKHGNSLLGESIRGIAAASPLT